MKDNGSKEDCFDQIFLMDEDITPLDYPEHNESKFLQMIQKINIMLPSHPSSNSIFSNSSASNSRPSSRLGSLTTNSSALSTPRPLNRQCHTPSPYFWQASVPTTPTHPITDDDIALSFRDIFEDSDFLSLNKPLNDISDEESDLEKTESEESEISVLRKINRPMTYYELETLRKQPARPMTDSMFDRSDDDECKHSHPFEI